MEQVLLVFIIPSVLWQGPRGGSKGHVLTVEKLNPVEIYRDPIYQTFSLDFSVPQADSKPLIYLVFL